jgi:hypothetical protein
VVAAIFGVIFLPMALPLLWLPRGRDRGDRASVEGTQVEVTSGATSAEAAAVG